MIRSILLVPAEGVPNGLLADGVPVAVVAGRHTGARGVYLPDYIRPGWGTVAVPSEVNGWLLLRVHPGEAALVLAWDGKPVAEGLFRAWCLGNALSTEEPRAFPTGWERQADIEEIAGWVEAHILYEQEYWGCKIVFLDEKGQEVTP